MDQEDTMDFQALRAKFQEEDLLLKQPKLKPALPEKPKVVPPPTSPTHYLPAGARPSLLTTINQTLEGNTAIAPRVIFKDDKKESKKPLFQTNSKSKEKSEGKQKSSKDKPTKSGKDSEESSEKQKKGSSKERKLLTLGSSKEMSGELVAATPPPKVQTPKKKGFMSFGKSLKKNSQEKVATDPILDTPSTEMDGVIPLIPVPSDFGDSEPELSPHSPVSPYSDVVMEMTPPVNIPAPPDFAPPPVFIPDIPTPEIQTPERETLPLITPTSTPAAQDEVIPNPLQSSPLTPSPPETVIAAVEAAAEKPPSSLMDPSSSPPSPKPERPISALSALERAEDMSPAKKCSPADQRILNALEKARRKISNSARTTPTSSHTVTPPPEELPQSPPSPTQSTPALPPIDYEDRFGSALSPKPAEVNGHDHTLGGVSTELAGVIPRPQMAPPPPPKKALPDLDTLGPAPEKPARPPTVNLFNFSPPLVNGGEEVHVPAEFPGTDTTDLPEFNDVASDAHSPELQMSEWESGRSTALEDQDAQNVSDYYSNSFSNLPAGVQVDTNGYQDNTQIHLPETPSPETQPAAGPQTDEGVYDTTDNMYEDVSTASNKKKGKLDAGKKRNRTPKNPYAEAAQETNEEKSKASRFGKNDKKAAAEGPDEKEQKKKEKQRLEKDKKEQKEKQERAKKEQKEREKRENEMKKKFNITGQEDAIYQATVTVTTKGRKNDLPVNNGDVVSIIRTTSCPKGKWLARDNSNNYGYIAVDHVELDIKEMLELGKKAAVSRQISSSNIVNGEVASVGSRNSNHYPLSTESFSDDSEEWACDDDEPVSPAAENPDPLAQAGHTRTLSMPDMGNKELSINHQHSQSDISADGVHVKARHEALQKLATFFHTAKPAPATVSPTELSTAPVQVTEEAVDASAMSSSQEMDFNNPTTLILPPPELYADFPMP
ncbi:uncharacterized protein ACB058_007569 [Synchiropus picturatus]